MRAAVFVTALYASLAIIAGVAQPAKKETRDYVRLRDWAAPERLTDAVPCFWRCPDDFWNRNDGCDNMCGSIDYDCYLHADGPVSVARHVEMRREYIERVLDAATKQMDVAREIAKAALENEALGLVYKLRDETTAIDAWNAATEHNLRGRFVALADKISEMRSTIVEAVNNLGSADASVRDLEAHERCFE